MKAILQRVKNASVTIDGEKVAEIGCGLLVLLGVACGDSLETVKLIADKTANLRIFEDDNEKMNFSLKDIAGETLVVPNFTLYADCKKGRRPSFCSAAKPDIAKSLYEDFCKTLEDSGIKKVSRGVFGADMKVELLNDGPVTIILDSEELQ